MNPIQSDPLSDWAQAQCMDYGATIWLHGTPSGHRVALEDAPGPYVIYGTKAVEVGGRGGYRPHRDHCQTIAAVRTSVDVVPDECDV